MDYRRLFFKRNPAALDRSRTGENVDTSNEAALQESFQQTEYTLQESFQNIGISVSRPLQKRFWNVKAGKRPKNNRHGAVKILFTVAGVSLACLVSVARIPDEYRIVIWIISLALLIMSDSLHFFDRFLAFQSRTIIACLLLIIAAYEFIGMYTGLQLKGLINLAGIIGVGGLILILVLNKSWLAAEQWLMTDAGQTALLTDVDNRATRAWQAAGRRETRSLLYTLGMETTDNALDIIHRPVWLAGYLAGNAVIVKYRQRVESLEAKAKRTVVLEDKLQEMENLREDYKRCYKECAELSRELRSSNKEYEALQAEYNILHSKHEQALACNEELIAELDRLEPAGDRPKKEDGKSDLQKILDLIEKGESQAGASRILGISKAKVSRMLKEAREAGDIPPEHPAFKSNPIIKTA